MGITTRSAMLTQSSDWWEVTELDLDEPKAGEVLIRVEASGMCHSDDHLRTKDNPCRYPMVGGHEGAGVVEQIGPDVTRVRAGDRIVCSFIPACGTCRSCAGGRQNLCERGANAMTGAMADGTYRWHRNGEDVGGFCCLGTFSERAVIAEYSCVPLDDDIPFELGALLACGVPTGFGTAVYAAGVRAGDSVVIYGCGGVGVNAVQGAALAGARQVIVVDPVPFKRDAAMRFGATHTFARHDEAAEFVRASTWGELADHALVTVSLSGQEVIDQALEIVGKRGQVTITSIGRYDQKQIVTSSDLLLGFEKRIKGALFGSCNPLHDIPRLARLYRSGKLKLDELITRRYSLDEINDGYRDLLAGRNLRGMIVQGQH